MECPGTCWSPCPPAVVAWPLAPPLELQCCEEPGAQVGGVWGTGPGPKSGFSHPGWCRCGLWFQTECLLLNWWLQLAPVPTPWLTASEGFRKTPVGSTGHGVVPSWGPLQRGSVPTICAPWGHGARRGPCACVVLSDSFLLLPAACSQNTNRTCQECLKNVSCLWCNTNRTCLDYPVAKLLPPASLCKLSSARWGVCWVNFEALIIAMSVIGGSILLAVAMCCCCCCCGTKRSRKPDRTEEKVMREQEGRRIRQEERRAEMKSRHDEIRKKYGLFKEENPYARFENN
ncbi:Pituitary tumor-transforming protein 1 protein-interacting protein [Pteropus alecto]|uniref:Pituitary tumor-transforming protein 1 protein-interacting protein n=1 Tax=Pteropus alecto TaxID=9402 RepID=L5JYJ2_PTEAL|nr:Pituitary tumor-transforming protein 1 protein-interacting protein [Pteropus alecto]